MIIYLATTGLAIGVSAAVYYCMKRKATEKKPIKHVKIDDKPYVIPDETMDSILATAQFYKDLDTKKGYLNAIEHVRRNPRKEPGKPHDKKREDMKKAMRGGI